MSVHRSTKARLGLVGIASSFVCIASLCVVVGVTACGSDEEGSTSATKSTQGSGQAGSADAAPMPPIPPGAGPAPPPPDEPQEPDEDSGADSAGPPPTDSGTGDG